MDIVSALRQTLADNTGQDRFALWFGAPDCLRIEGNLLVITAQDQFSLDQLRRSFRDDLQFACTTVIGRPLNLEFRVETSVSAVESDVGPDEVCQPSPQPPADTKKKTQPKDNNGRSPQRRFANLSSFVVGDGNRVAHTAMEMTAKRPGAVTPLFIYGPAGCGKTHLLEGVWSALRRGSKMRRVVMLSAEQFTSFFLEALRGSGLPSFRRRYRDLDLLLIDDVQFFAGKRATLIELQHTIDTLLREGRQMVFSADRGPVELNGLGPELTTRLSGGLVCGVEPPDKSTRLGITKKFCRDRKYTFPPDVLEMVAAEMCGDARQISGALNRLHATSQALQQPMTVELARTALADIIRSTQPTVRMPDIERAVCDVFGLEPKVLQSSRKSRSVSEPRMLAMWLARKYTRAAYSEIGHYFGRRSHSTVISAQKKVGSWMNAKKLLQLSHGNCSMEDALRRVEEQLRTG